MLRTLARYLLSSELARLRAEALFYEKLAEEAARNREKAERERDEAQADLRRLRWALDVVAPRERR